MIYNQYVQSFDAGEAIAVKVGTDTPKPPEAKIPDATYTSDWKTFDKRMSERKASLLAELIQKFLTWLASKR